MGSLVVALVSVSTEAFTPLPKPSFFTATTSSSLDGCRVNGKKEKRQRNRENMRKFSSGGKKGLSRRKLMKKALASKARQDEAEFIAKCFITIPAIEEVSG